MLFRSHTLNEWILRRIGGSWAYPQDIKYLLEDQKLVPKLANILQNEISSYRFNQFWGFNNLLKKKTILNNMWGWKDPRNSFTLPIWLKIFPNPKVIYMKRNGIDIAASLVKRQTKYSQSENFNPFIKQTFVQKIKNFIIPIEIHQYNALKCINLEESYKLWELYTRNCEEIYNKLKTKKISLRYEDLLSDPISKLSDLVKFLEISVEPQLIEKMVVEINTDRKFAFLKNKQLVEFYRNHKDDKQMKNLRYDNII